MILSREIATKWDSLTCQKGCSIAGSGLGFYGPRFGLSNSSRRWAVDTVEGRAVGQMPTTVRISIPRLGTYHGQEEGSLFSDAHSISNAKSHDRGHGVKCLASVQLRFSLVAILESDGYFAHMDACAAQSPEQFFQNGKSL